MKRTAFTFVLATLIGALGVLSLRPAAPVRAASTPGVSGDIPDTKHVSALGECAWVVNTTQPGVDGRVEAQCANGSQVISGGCDTDVSTRFNGGAGPYEGTDSEDHPDDNEAYNALTNQSGWYCAYGTVGTEEVTAFALCCG